MKRFFIPTYANISKKEHTLSLEDSVFNLLKNHDYEVLKVTLIDEGWCLKIYIKGELSNDRMKDALELVSKNYGHKIGRIWDFANNKEKNNVRLIIVK